MKPSDVCTKNAFALKLLDIKPESATPRRPLLKTDCPFWAYHILEFLGIFRVKFGAKFAGKSALGVFEYDFVALKCDVGGSVLKNRFWECGTKFNRFGLGFCA